MSNAKSIRKLFGVPGETRAEGRGLYMMTFQIEPERVEDLLKERNIPIDSRYDYGNGWVDLFITINGAGYTLRIDWNGRIVRMMV